LFAVIKNQDLEMGGLWRQESYSDSGKAMLDVHQYTCLMRWMQADEHYWRAGE
jgi:hypothetical protein